MPFAWHIYRGVRRRKRQNTLLTNKNGLAIDDKVSRSIKSKLTMTN